MTPADELYFDTVINSDGVQTAMIKPRIFRYHGRSVDLTDSGVSLRLVYKEV